MGYLRFVGPIFTENSSGRKLSCTNQTDSAKSQVLFGSKLLHIRRSLKHHDRSRPLLEHKDKHSNESWNQFHKSRIPGASPWFSEQRKSEELDFRFFVTQILLSESSKLNSVVFFIKIHSEFHFQCFSIFFANLHNFALLKNSLHFIDHYEFYCFEKLFQVSLLSQKTLLFRQILVGEPVWHCTSFASVCKSQPTNLTVPLNSNSPYVHKHISCKGLHG